jgi:hypothetical protein
MMVDGSSTPCPAAGRLEGVRPNAASGNGLHVAFALPTGAAARLDLDDQWQNYESSSDSRIS